MQGFIGIFDPLMERIYRRYGVSPEILGQANDNQGQIVKLGIWHNDNIGRAQLQSRVERAKMNAVPTYEKADAFVVNPLELIAS